MTMTKNKQTNDNIIRMAKTAFPDKQVSNSEWLPTSIYEQVDGPSFEIYGGTAEKGYIELWYPIRKKQEQI